MLNSAAGVTLPISKPAPPMTTISPILAAISGALIKAIAMLVKGPIAHNVTEPGSAERSASMMKSTPCCACNGITGSGRSSFSPSESPWIAAAEASVRSSGRAQPAKTLMSGRPASSQTRRAFRSVCASGRLPATATIPSTSSSSGDDNASKIATASSMPGSVSMIILRGSMTSSCRTGEGGEP